MPFQDTSVPRKQKNNAGWSSPVARQAHNLKVAGSNPAPATKWKNSLSPSGLGLFLYLDDGDHMERNLGKAL
jgi:hypothetical protein